MNERRHPTSETGEGNANGKSEAFSRLVHDSYNRIYLSALAITRNADMAEDVAQETFLRAWLKRDSVKGSVSELQPWLLRVASNMALQWLRTGQTRSRLLPLIPLEDVTVEPVDTLRPGPRDSAISAEQNTQLVDAVMHMPDDLRQAVLLHYAEGMSPSDIARLNGEAPSTVTRRLDKARAQLRTHLESGLAAGLAMMKPAPHSLEKTLGILGAAMALPAATRAQLLQLAADTPPLPMIDPVTSAASSAASYKEAGIMKGFIAKTGAAKLLAGFAAAAVIGGGVYTVNLLVDPSREAGGPLEATPAHIVNAGFDTTRITKRAVLPSKSVAQDTPGKNSNANSAAVSDSDNSKTRRLTPDERVALLKNDLVSTHPKLVIKDGETSGRIHLDIAVVDESGMPVKDATVKVPQFGFDETWGTGNIGVPVAQHGNYKTNASGIARISVPQYVREDVPTQRVTVEASHPDYTSTRNDMRFTSITKLVLTAGKKLEVIATDEKSSAPLMAGLEPVFNSMFEPEWYQRPDGTLVFSKIGGETLKFYLKHTGADGDKMLSTLQRIKLPHQDEGPLYITMHPTLTVNGVLSDNVPRPVKDMEVEFAYLTPEDGTPVRGGILTDKIPVAEDGTFTLTGLPKGQQIHVSAIGVDYCSVVPDGDDHMARPQTFIAEQDNQAYVLPMNKTGTAVLKLVDADGNPAMGAIVGCSPTICYFDNCKTWENSNYKLRGTSDENGMVVLAGLPPLMSVSFHVTGGWVLPTDKSGPFKTSSLSFEPGQTIEKTVTVISKESYLAGLKDKKWINVPEGGSITYQMNEGKTTGSKSTSGRQ